MKNTLKISVVIATYNRQGELLKVIDGLLNQKMMQDYNYEIIIVDNNSTDQTQTTVESLIPRSAGKIRYLKQELKGKSIALNLGIQESTGEIIAFTDDDVEVPEYWLFSLIDCFDNYHCDGVGGRVLPIYPLNTPSWAYENPNQMAGAVVIYDQGKKTMLAGSDMPRFIGANWAFKRDVFKDCGVFRTDLGPGTEIKLGEDEEFYQRLVQNHKILYYCAEALIWHPVDLSRLTLEHIAQWHISLGRFEAIKEYKSQKSNLKFIAGIPRYIFKDIIGDLFLILLNIFNILKFRYYIRSFFRKLGMIYEYRNIQRSS